MRVLAAILIFTGTISFMPPASAASCGSVKKQILNFEENIRVNLRSIRKYDNVFNVVPSSQATKILSIHKKLESNLQNVWKLGFNNPKCLSNTQKLTLEQPWMYADSNNYVYISRFYGQTPNLTVYMKDPFISFFKF